MKGWNIYALGTYCWQIADFESLGIPKLEREAERLYQQCERRAAMETTYSDDGTYMMKLELLLRKSLCDRLDSLLESDLSRVQIRSLRVSLFDNFFRLGSKGRPRLAENV